MKKILSIILIVACLFSLSSCAIIPAYDGDDLKRILRRNGYEIEEKYDVDHQGVAGYIYARNGSEMLYYIYCNDYFTTKTIYKGTCSELDVWVSELQIEIKEMEAKLNSPDISASEKGKCYERYLILKDELERAQNFGCGHGINVVWFGTKQAIKDIRFGN